MAQWLELPSKEGREFDSHLELGIFSELSGVRILLLPNYNLTCLDLTKKLLK